MVTDNKRKRSSEREILGEGTSAKLLKLTSSAHVKAPVPRSCSKSGTPKFQRFHLLLMQSLYETDETYGINEDDSIGSVTEDYFNDDTVDVKLFRQVRKFVNERENLLLEKQESSHLKDIHAEALDYIGERGGTHATPKGKRAWRLEDDVIHHCPTASPHSLAFFSPQRSIAASQQHINSDVGSPAKCFGLVATLLKKRSRSFDCSVIRKSNPFGPLLQETEAKITTLETKLLHLQRRSHSQQKQKVEDLLSCAMHISAGDALEGAHGEGDLESFIAKLETKVGLWNLLATDLREIVPSTNSSQNESS